MGQGIEPAPDIAAPCDGGDPDAPSIETRVRLSPSLVRRLAEVALAQDLTQGEIIRRALRAHLGASAVARSGAADDELLPHIRELVARAIRRAQNWAHLQGLLAEDDLAYQIAGGGLAIQALPSGRKLCKASEVGPGYAALVRRLGPFPGHPHRWIADRIAQADEQDALIEPEIR